MYPKPKQEPVRKSRGRLTLAFTPKLRFTRTGVVERAKKISEIKAKRLFEEFNETESGGRLLWNLANASRNFNNTAGSRAGTTLTELKAKSVHERRASAAYFRGLGVFAKRKKVSLRVRVNLIIYGFKKLKELQGVS